MTKKLTKFEYIDKCRKTHGDRYIYDNLIYVNNATKVTITCKIHGDFQQHPSDHRRGFGCPECSKKSKRDY